MRADDELMVFILKERRQPSPANGGGDLFVEVPGVLTFPGRAIEGINVLEVRRGSIQTPAVDNQVAIVPDAYVLAAQGDEAPSRSTNK